MGRCVRCGKNGIMLKVNQQGLCLDCERQVAAEYIQQLQARLSPEQQNIVAMQNETQRLNQIISQLNQQIAGLNATIQGQQNQLGQINAEIQRKQAAIIQMDDTILFQEFGLYQPTYSFCNAEEYKCRLDQIREQQKQMIKAGTAVVGNMNWTVNGSQSQGKKMVKDMQKLLLRAFNGECDEVVSKVKYSNFEQSKKRIVSSCEAISKLGAMMNISISPLYQSLKIQELTLAFEYATKKQEEKEAQRAAREQMREEAKLQKEIAEARKKAEKEQTHYQTALSKLNKQIEQASPEEVPALMEKKSEIEKQLVEIDKSMQEIDYREANQRAGYVYVISNIGSFGENVYKIGMTRRLDPTERVDELGDASVPFNFDIHAMIFSDDAPALEAALHRAFDSRKVNMVNRRREFFNVTLDEIKAVVRQNFDQTAEFIDVADAEQFRISQKMRQQGIQ